MVQLIETELAAVGGRPKYPVRRARGDLARALRRARAGAPLDPRAITDETLDVVLALLYDALGVPGDA